MINLHHRRFPDPICCDAHPGGNPLVPGRTGDGTEDASRLSRCLEYNSPVVGRHRHRQLCGHVLCGALLQCDHHMVLLLPFQLTTGNNLSYRLLLAHGFALGISFVICSVGWEVQFLVHRMRGSLLYLTNTGYHFLLASLSY